MSSIDLVADLLARREPACGATRVVAIDGPSGSGKTTFADQLAEATCATVLHLEDLYEGWHGLETAPPKVVTILSAIAVGEVGRVPTWDWTGDQAGDDLVIAPAEVLVVEGVGAASSTVCPFVNVVVWVDGPEEERRHRALMRDGDTYAPWWDVWARQERAHFEREGTRARADVVLGL